MLSADGLYNEMKKVESIVNALPVSALVKCISSLTTIYNVGSAGPLQKNNYTIADTYAYGHTVISALLAVKQNMSKEKKLSEARGLLACYRAIAINYHRIPASVFDKVFNNRVLLFRELSAASTDISANFTRMTDALYKIISYDTKTNEFFDFTAGEIPTLLTDFLESVPSEFAHQTALQDAIATYSEVIPKAIKTGFESYPPQSSYAHSSVGKGRTSAPQYSEKTQRKSIKPIIFTFLTILFFVWCFIYARG